MTMNIHMPSQLKFDIQHDTPAPALSEHSHTPCYDNLNKLEWPHHFAFECFGARIAVRSESIELLEELQKYVPSVARPYEGEVVDCVFSAIRGGKKPNSRVRTFHMLYQNHSPVVRSRKPDDLLNGFDTWLPIVLAHTAREGVFVHAGVVAWKGRAIVVPGPTQSGKTTLIQELVKAGAEYFSDDYAVIDPDGQVHPYPKPLAVKTKGSLEARPVQVEDLGGRQAKAPAPVGLVVMTRYKEGARWRPRRLSSGQGALALLSNTVAVQSTPEKSLQTMASISEQARVVRTPRGEAAEAAGKILRMIDRVA